MINEEFFERISKGYTDTEYRLSNNGLASVLTCNNSAPFARVLYIKGKLLVYLSLIEASKELLILLSGLASSLLLLLLLSSLGLTTTASLLLSFQSTYSCLQ